VLVQGLSIACAYKFFLAFEEDFLLCLETERDHGELTMWSVTGVGECCCLRLALAIIRQGQELFSDLEMIQYALAISVLFSSLDSKVG